MEPQQGQLWFGQPEALGAKPRYKIELRCVTRPEDKPYAYCLLIRFFGACGSKISKFGCEKELPVCEAACVKRLAAQHCPTLGVAACPEAPIGRQQKMSKDVPNELS